MELKTIIIDSILKDFSFVNPVDKIQLTDGDFCDLHGKILQNNDLKICFINSKVDDSNYLLINYLSDNKITSFFYFHELHEDIGSYIRYPATLYWIPASMEAIYLQKSSYEKMKYLSFDEIQDDLFMKESCKIFLSGVKEVERQKI